MKKLLLTIGLVASVTLAYGQGTINLSNSGFQRISSANASGTILAALPGTPAGSFIYTFWVGSSAASLSQLQGVTGYNSTSTTGVIAGADGRTPLNPIAIPGFSQNTQPFIQVRAVSADGLWAGQTPIIQTVPLGADNTGPAVALWQLSTGTSLNQFKPAQLLLQPVPEPSTLALAGLGVASLLIFRRRK